MRKLLESGVPWTWTKCGKNRGAVPPFYLGAGEGHEGIVIEQVLKANKVDVHKATNNGCYTPLSVAALEGHEGVVEKLLKAGAAVINKASRDVGATSLWNDAYEGHEGVVQQLLEAGADANNLSPDHLNSPLYAAARQGHEGVVEKFLKAEAYPHTEQSPLVAASVLEWLHQGLLITPARRRSKHEHCDRPW